MYLKVEFEYDEIEIALAKQDFYQGWYSRNNIAIESFIYICKNNFILEFLII